MVDRIIDKNLNFLQKHGVKMDCVDDRAVYKYGLQILYYYLIDLIVIFSLAYIFGRLYETLIMILIFGVLQVFGGGYHAKTPFGCLAIMLAGVVVGNVLISLMAEYLIINIAIGIVLIGVILFLTPVVNKHHPVGKKMKRRSKMIIRVFSFILTIIVIALGYLNRNTEAAIIAVTIGAYMISWGTAKIKTQY